MRGRHVRSTMAPCRPRVGSPVGPDDLGRVRRQRHAQHPAQAMLSSSRSGQLPRRSGGALGRPENYSEGPEQRGSDPPFRGGPRPSASRRCGGPWGSLPLCPGQEVAAWRAAIGSRRRRAIDRDRDHDGDALSIKTAPPPMSRRQSPRNPRRPGRCDPHSSGLPNWLPQV